MREGKVSVILYVPLSEHEDADVAIAKATDMLMLLKQAGAQLEFTVFGASTSTTLSSTP